jgi:Flp pilus assembly protein protease CpaA
MISELVIPDELVIGFFTAVVGGLTTAVIILYRDRTKSK